MTTRVSDRGPLTFSVIICTRDRPVELETCLLGVSKQTLKPIEVLVVDNAPVHGSAEEIARRYGAKYILETHIGASCARNTGVGRASGDVVAFIDDDGTPDIDWLKNFSTAFQNEKVMAAGGRTVPPQVSAELTELFQLIQGVGSDKPIVLDKSHPQWFEMVAFGGISMGGTNMAFRRSVFNQWPGFDLRIGPPRSGCEDLFAFVSLVDAGFQAAYVPQALVMHPTTFSAEGLRQRYLTGCAHATCYMLFLFAQLPQHRRKLIKFVLEGFRGVRREWRPQSASVDSAKEIPAYKIHWARLKGIALYFRNVA